MSKSTSIKMTLIVSIVGVVLASQALSGVMQYRELASAKREEIRQLFGAVLQPSIDLAASGVEGGNSMILQNSEALSLYAASKVKYLKVSGMSAGSAKTAFSEAIPPQRIDYEFADAKEARIAMYRNAANAGTLGLDNDQLTYVIRTALPGVKNGGEIVAVFSAESLGGLEWRVASSVLLNALIISLASLGLAILIGRRISDPIVAMTRQISEINSAMDLSRRVTIKSTNEVGMTAQAFNDMMVTMQQIVSDMRRGVNAITGVAQELADGNRSLAQRTEEHAATLEETAASMEDLASTVRQNAESARQASQLASRANEIAEKGGAAVGKVASTMASIDESSKKVVGILGAIDEIAFQTNILALNAAVEAARAGEQGRGFAVVAAEVRRLAQRAAAAGKEINVLITDSANKVRQGDALVTEAARTMEEIVAAVKHVTDITADISAASSEQSAGIDQVNQSIVQMDQATQQNAALVEEVTAAMDSMGNEVHSLSASAEVFKLGDAAELQSAARNRLPPAASLRSVRRALS